MQRQEEGLEELLVMMDGDSGVYGIFSMDS